MSSWSALYSGGIAVVIAVSVGLPDWLVVVAGFGVVVGYGLHLRSALRMIDEWVERADRVG